MKNIFLWINPKHNNKLKKEGAVGVARFRAAPLEVAMTPELIKGTIDSCGGGEENILYVYGRVFYIKDSDYFYHACMLDHSKTYWYLYEIEADDLKCIKCRARFSEKKLKKHRAIIAITS